MRVDTGRLRVVGAAALDSAPSEDDEAILSPGAYVREHRVRAQMSLEQLAIATKIPRAQLELLEADRFDELPGSVFVKGFLRCCARVLDLDEDMLLALLYEQERARAPSSRRETGTHAIARERSRPMRRAPRPSVLHSVLGRLDALRERVFTSRLLLWIVVTLLVAAIVYAAFTLASGQISPDARS